MPSLWEWGEDDDLGSCLYPGPLTLPQIPGMLLALMGLILCYVWEKLPQSCQNKLEVGAVSGFGVVGAALLAAEVWWGGDQKRRHLALGAQPWPGPRTSDHLAVCPCAVAWPLWASVRHPFSHMRSIIEQLLHSISHFRGGHSGTRSRQGPSPTELYPWRELDGSLRGAVGC